MADDSESPGLWFERLYAFLRLPFWAGTLLFGLGPFLLISGIVGYLLSLWGFDVNPPEFLFTTAITSILVVWAQFAARSARRGVEEMEEYTRDMRRGKPLGLGPLYSPVTALIAIVVVELLTQPVYLLSWFPEEYTMSQRLILAGSYAYVDLFTSTLIWVLLYSMYTIYRVGRLELDLKHFSEERSLGLHPVGRLSLKLTGLYVLFLALELIPDALGGTPQTPILVFMGVVLLLAFAFFLLPLIPLRRQLLREKRALLNRLAPRFVRLYRSIDSSLEGEVRQVEVNELTALEAMKRNIEAIHSWPFDTAAVVRLSVIVFSVTAIILSRVIASLLGI